MSVIDVVDPRPVKDVAESRTTHSADSSIQIPLLIIACAVAILCLAVAAKHVRGMFR